MSLQLVVNLTDEDIQTRKLLQEHTNFDCRYCKKRAYWSLEQIMQHEESCGRN